MLLLSKVFRLFMPVIFHVLYFLERNNNLMGCSEIHHSCFLAVYIIHFALFVGFC